MTMTPRELIEAVKARCWVSVSGYEHAELIYSIDCSDLIAQVEGMVMVPKEWFDDNMSYYNVDADWPIDAPNVPALAQVSERIWYHATDDMQSTTFSEVIAAA